MSFSKCQTSSDEREMVTEMVKEHFTLEDEAVSFIFVIESCILAHVHHKSLIFRSELEVQLVAN